MKNRSFLIISIFIACIFIFCGCQRANQTSDVNGEQSDKPIIDDVQSIKIMPGDESSDNGNKVTDEKNGYEELIPAGKAIGFETLYGYADKERNFTIGPRFKEVLPFYACGLAIVTDVDDKTGLIDTLGNYVVEPQTSSVSYSEGSFIFYNYDNSITNVYDEKGSLIFSTEGLIYDFSEGLSSYTKDEITYIIDKNGEILCELENINISDFKNGIAKAQKGYFGPSYMIDEYGNDLTDTVSSGLRMVKIDDCFGYEDNSGNMLIDAVYSSAEPFVDGFAVVAISQEYEPERFGIIDTDGNYVLEPKYLGIARMANGTYKVGSSEADVEESVPSYFNDYYEKAIFSKDLKKHTDWIYLDAADIDSSIMHVSEKGHSYYMDADLNQIDTMPVFKGVGAMLPDGDLLRGELNGKMTIADRNGNILLQDNGTIMLGNGIYTTEEIYSPSLLIKIGYPQINGLYDKEVQDKINETLKQELFLPNQPSSYADDMYVLELDVHTDVSRKDDLLEAELSSYSYAGGAHGFYFTDILYINIRNGNTYELSDLFISPSDALIRLSEIVSEKMKENFEDGGYFEDHVNPDQINDFYLEEEGITLHFGLYEIACYAAGTQDFYIPFEDIREYINEEGEFWKSFNHKRSLIDFFKKP